ncbi:MAG: TIGR03936 family radical SAM-associated protein [Acetanaerobacterium sp.]
MSAMKSVRLWFSKEGRAVYISHLDMMRCMQRALKRAGIPVWYTEGFNPHIYLTFALPLSLGFASDCESLDVRLVGEMSFDEIVRRMSAALPMGMCIQRAAEPNHKPEAIAYADYRLVFRQADAAQFLPQWEAFIAQPVIAWNKKTKKGYKEINLKDYIISTTAQTEDGDIVVTARLLAGITENLNPTLLIEAFRKVCDCFGHVSVRRTAVLDRELLPFE